MLLDCAEFHGVELFLGKHVFAMNTSVTWQRNLLEAFGRLDAVRGRC